MISTTAELAAFLRTRRERLDPRAVGLPERRSRRTPGLRREEVAELAGISVDYVVRLEQARGLRPSADVVEALAGALRLAPDERAYLYGLTRQRPRGTAEPATTADPALAALVADLAPRPAMVLNHRYDVLAWNDAMARLFLDFGTLPPARRNAILVCLVDPRMRTLYADRDQVVRDGVAHLRTAWAAHPDDRVLGALIAECVAGDEQFARLWASGEVRVNARGHKVLHHPDAGVITTRFETLRPVQDPGQLVVVHRAADATSQSALDALTA
ncbi:helix-turn-helix transcriptional regulator [Lentzea sp. NPDC042327]|uniref:helix-turn-helix transcriptional regulator n=1 Tax=Lentzea sp. NPDC042327 TaxID=3154801 RepID=UPI0033E0B7E7